MVGHNGFQDSVRKEMSELQELRSQLMSSLREVPEGSLQILCRKGRAPQHYQYINRSTRKYIPKANRDLAVQLAQKEYDNKLLKHVDERIEALKPLAQYNASNVDEIFTSLSPIKQQLLVSHIQTDEEYIRAWYEKHPGEMNTYPNHSEQYTVRGEHVRSKSEKLLADMFERHGIPYIYEPMITLPSGKTVCPDFLILNVRLRKTCIFEHFGMMDDVNYAEDVCHKMQAYIANGIFPGKNMLFSMETKRKQMNEKVIEKMVMNWMEL